MLKHYTVLVYVFVVLLVTMPPPKKKNGPAKPVRQKISIEVKQFAIEKYNQNVANKDICAMIKERFKIEVGSSTVATWNTEKSRNRIEAMGVDKITSKELRVNQQQRSRIIVDMEYFLVMYIERQQDKSSFFHCSNMEY